YREKGDWDKAVADYSEVIRLDPNDPNPWYRLALIRLSAGRHDEYRKDCAGMLQRFGQTVDTNNARWTAWSCALAPNSVGDWSKVVALAETTVKSGREPLRHQTILGAVLYRAGRF